MKKRFLLFFLLIFMGSCIQLKMPPVDNFIAVLLGLAGSKKSEATTPPSSESPLPPTII